MNQATPIGRSSAAAELWMKGAKQWLPVTLFVTALLCVSVPALGQGSTFTYQGRLQDGGAGANGSYDFQFTLWDAANGGAQQPASAPVTVTRTSVPVANGIFTVSLDFGASAFSGPDRYLEISVRLAGNGPFSVLSPRLQITSTPYAVRSLNATSADTALNASQLGGVVANQYVVTSDSRLSDPRPPTAGNSNYIQNTTNPQANSNFSISGTGTAGGTLSANVVNAASQYNLAGSQVLSTKGIANLFVGWGAGANNTTGYHNSFVGYFAGVQNTTGVFNSFFGKESGRSNTSGNYNAFFGEGAGLSNSTASYNVFFGQGAGFFNTSGEANTFLGAEAGRSNTIGYWNTFVGRDAGWYNDTGTANSFFGKQSGFANATGSENSFFGEGSGYWNVDGMRNTFIGRSAGFFKTGVNNTFIGTDAGSVDGVPVNNSVAIGYNAIVSSDHTIVLGTGAETTNVPGTLTVGSNAPTRGQLSLLSPAGNADLYLQAAGAASGINFGVNSGAMLFIAQYDGTTYQDRLVINTDGTVSVPTLGVAGATQLCRNYWNQIGTCSSSLRYKSDVHPFRGGLDIVARLRPISFVWKEGQMRDVGLAAEEVENVEPLLTFRNEKGAIEGVKYDQLSAVFINAFKEQQELIQQQQVRLQQEQNRAEQQQAQLNQQKQRLQQQQERLARQQQELDALKRLICRSQRRARVCR